MSRQMYSPYRSRSRSRSRSPSYRYDGVSPNKRRGARTAGQKAWIDALREVSAARIGGKTGTKLPANEVAKILSLHWKAGKAQKLEGQALANYAVPRAIEDVRALPEARIAAMHERPYARGRPRSPRTPRYPRSVTPASPTPADGYYGSRYY